jgi:hypothetical protein
MAAKYRREREQEGGTYNSRNMSLPGFHKGRLAWEVRPGELRQAYAAGVDGYAYPPAQRMGRDNG